MTNSPDRKILPKHKHTIQFGGNRRAKIESVGRSEPRHRIYPCDR